MGATNLEKQVKSILKEYKEEFVNKLHTQLKKKAHFTKSVFVAAAFLLAAQRNKVKVDRKQLLLAAECGAHELNETCKQMQELCKVTLAKQPNVKVTMKTSPKSSSKSSSKPKVNKDNSKPAPEEGDNTNSQQVQQKEDVKENQNLTEINKLMQTKEDTSTPNETNSTKKGVRRKNTDKQEVAPPKKKRKLSPETTPLRKKKFKQLTLNFFKAPQNPS